MSDFLTRISQYSPKRLALLADELQSKLSALEHARREPIAIIGVGCRFPGGANDLESYWRLLSSGSDAISEVPASRWPIDTYFDPDPDAPGKMSTRFGGFVDAVDEFDAAFFGISPREAQSMDPQHRLLLEVTWQALEHAGIAPPQLEGSRTSVYVGVSATDYYQILRGRGIGNLDAYTASGVAPSIASGRLSYTLGLKGPSMTIDTSCSSSLVAAHQAVQSLRRGESDLAIAGGVNLILSPEITIALSKAHMMAADGRCKTFDARADGYVRGEGCGVLVLKRLSDARRDKDRVLAVIRGSASNQDGRSNGLTAPNGPSQEAVLRAALLDAQAKPHEVSCIEAHGTGTSLGDPIEMQALGAVLGAGRGADSPLLVGSVKANIGHLESAAGVAGLIKLILCLTHRAVPPQIHLQNPNPYIPWDSLPIRVPRKLTALASDGALVGGISSFGFSGTNAHLVLEGPQPRDLAGAQRIAARAPQLLLLSAASEPALRATARRYAAFLGASDDSGLANVCYTANSGRAPLAHRLALIAESAAGTARQLAEYADGGALAGVPAAHLKTADRPGVAFLFTGQGSQYVGMGRGLYAASPEFRSALDRCDALFRPLIGRSVIQAMQTGDAASLRDTSVAQPAIFSLECALASMWQSWGLRPAAVLGHSLGEFVAAHVAGVFSLEDAVRLVAARARLMGALPAGGVMLAVFAEEDRVRRFMAEESAAAVAAVNAPDSTVVSGSEAAVDALAKRLNGSGIETRTLDVSHAFHSPLMRPMLDEFSSVAASVTYQTPTLRIVSNVTGTLARGPVCASAGYWRNHVIEPVRYADGIGELDRLGIRVFLELGPHAVLGPLGARSAPEARFIATLQSGRDDWRQVMEASAQLFLQGASLDWRSVEAGQGREIVSAPFTEFERRHCWVKPVAVAANAAETDALTSAMTQAAEQRAESERAVGEWLYAVDWRETPLASVPRPAGNERWVIASSSALAADAIASRCAEQGIRCAVVVHTGLESLAQRLQELRSSAGPPVTSLIFVATPEEDGADPAGVIALDCAAADAWLTVLSKAGSGLRMWLVTTGAQPIGGAPENVSQGAMAAWGRVAALEYPQHFAGIIDLDARNPDSFGEALASAVGASDGEDQVAYRDGRRLAARLERLKLQALSTPAPWYGDRSYLITGWMGGLGLQLVRWLADCGVRHLVLVGRRAVDRSDPAMLEVVDTVDALGKRGVSLHYVQSGVSDEPAMRILFARFGADLPALAGIFHAAADVTDAAIGVLPEAALQRMMLPKVTGAWLLDALSSGTPLNHFVLFSSSAAVIGAHGLAHYAASNAALEAIAYRRRARGQTALAISWGAWESMRHVSNDERERFRRSGMLPMRAATALSTYATANALGRAQLMVADIDWPTLKSVYEARRARPLFRDIVVTVAPAGNAEPGIPESERILPWNFDGVAPPRRADALLENVRGEIGRVLGLSVADVEPSRGLFEMGLDSLMTVELRERLARRTGRTLPTTLTFNYPNAIALAGFIAGLLFRADAVPAPAASINASADDSEEALERLLAAKLREVGG